MLLYQILACIIRDKLLKKSYTKTMSLKHHLQHGMKNLIYLRDNILYQMFKIILNIS